MSSIFAGILGHIFGERRTNVEAGVGKATGLDQQKIGKPLTILAPIVMAALAPKAAPHYSCRDAAVRSGYALALRSAEPRRDHRDVVRAPTLHRRVDQRLTRRLRRR
jgi:hypothetical protein